MLFCSDCVQSRKKLTRYVLQYDNDNNIVNIKDSANKWAYLTCFNFNSKRSPFTKRRWNQHQDNAENISWSDSDDDIPSAKIGKENANHSLVLTVYIGLREAKHILLILGNHSLPWAISICTLCLRVVVNSGWSNSLLFCSCNISVIISLF